ncbi:MAG: DUF6157 family protein [Bacteroidota bacterium]
MHTTNYFNAFIEIAEDSPIDFGQEPPLKGSKKSVANLQFEMVKDNPYRYTSDEVLFGVFAQRKDFTEAEMEAQRAQYFSKGQPCFRASPLSKRYGWGVHSDAEGRVAIFGADTEEYRRLAADPELKHYRAMRSKRK